MRMGMLAVWSWVFFFCASTVPLNAGEGKPAWEREWEKIVDAANNERQPVIYHTRGPFDKVFAAFNKRDPGIKIVSVVGRGSELTSRIMAERRAGKHAVDLYIGATATPLLYRAKVPVPAAK